MSTLDTLFEQIDAMIATHVAAIEDHNAQIEALKVARKALQDTTPEAPKSTRRTRRNKSSEEDEPIKMVTEKQLLWLERKGYDGENPEELTREEASKILDELFNGIDDEPEVVEETPRAKRTAKASRTRTKRTNVKNGNGNGNSKSKNSEPKTRKDAILALHSEGLKPREIADELEANVSYVYLILRQQREASQK
jgi:hypothetical protein